MGRRGDSGDVSALLLPPSLAATQPRPRGPTHARPSSARRLGEVQNEWSMVPLLVVLPGRGIPCGVPAARQRLISLSLCLCVGVRVGAVGAPRAALALVRPPAAVQGSPALARRQRPLHLLPLFWTAPGDIALSMQLAFMWVRTPLPQPMTSPRREASLWDSYAQGGVVIRAPANGCSFQERAACLYSTTVYDALQPYYRDERELAFVM